MKAYIFPGQGSQYVGMARDFYVPGSPGADIIAEASEILGYDLLKLCMDGPQEKLAETRYNQPAVYSVSCAMFADAGGHDADVMAGHSLGEYAALFAAGAYDFTGGLEIVAKRGDLMQSASRQHQGAMYAVLGLQVLEVEDAVTELSSVGKTYIANENSPEQIVITTTIADEEIIQKVFTERKAKKIIKIAVSGAFHSPLMAEAAAEFRIFLADKEFKATKVPVLANCDAKPMLGGDDTRDKLAMQLTGRVRWAQILSIMAEMGVDEFIEAGPGKVLQGLVRRNLPDAKTSGLDITDRAEIAGNRS